MKKLLIVTIEFPPQKGGVANYLAGLARALPAEKVVVLAPKNPLLEKRNKGEFEALEKKENYKIYYENLISKSPFLWPKWLPMVWHLWHVARQEKAEAILVGQILPVGTAAFFIKKILGVPYFVSCHGMDILAPQKSKRKKKLMIKVLNAAAGVIANSQFTKNEVIKLGVLENKIAVVYPCPGKVVPLFQKVIDELKKKYSLENKKILLTVGRLVQRKGHDKVIEALPLVLERVPDIVYVAVGDGPERKNLQVTSYKLQVQDNILFTGEISDEKLKAFYELCDIFVMLSRQIGPDVEGFGTVYLEANQFGKPVIAGRSGGVAEAVEDGVTGLLVEPENVDQITEAIVKLLTNKDLARELGEEGRRRVKEKFRWEIQAEKFKRLLE